MTNRRFKQRSTKRRESPENPGHFVHPEDAPDEGVPGPRRAVLGYVISGAKVLVGVSLVLLASGALAYGLYRYALSTPRFSVTELVVEGTRRLGRDEVLGAAALSPGQNIFRLDIPAAEASLVESPWIKKARVTRRLPGTVRVEIVERQPVALAVVADETFLVAEDGEPFKLLGSGDPHDLPLVTGLSVAELKRDRRAELARLLSALVLLRDYESLPIGRAYPAEEVHLTDSGHAVLTVGREGSAVHLGAAPWKGKLLRAARVIEKTARKGGKAGVVFLDNEAHPERVVVRVR